MKKNIIWVLICAVFAVIGSVTGWNLYLRIATVLSALVVLVNVVRGFRGK